jgi:hypothetical protein
MIFRCITNIKKLPIAHRDYSPPYRCDCGAQAWSVIVEQGVAVCCFACGLRRGIVSDHMVANQDPQTRKAKGASKVVRESLPAEEPSLPAARADP